MLAELDEPQGRRTAGSVHRAGSAGRAGGRDPVPRGDGTPPRRRTSESLAARPGRSPTRSTNSRAAARPGRLRRPDHAYASSQPGGPRAVWGSYRDRRPGRAGAARYARSTDGVLRDFLRSQDADALRGRHSNGHGRHDGLQPPMARMANLVMATAAEDHGQVLGGPPQRLLIETAKKQGRSQAMIISSDSLRRDVHGRIRLSGVQGRAGGSLRGRRRDRDSSRRVRDVELIGTPSGRAAANPRVRSAQDRPRARSRLLLRRERLDSGHGNGSAPILLSEVEMQQSSTTGFHEPLLPPPFSDDGRRDSRRHKRRMPRS